MKPNADNNSRRLARFAVVEIALPRVALVRNGRVLVTEYSSLKLNDQPAVLIGSATSEFQAESSQSDTKPRSDVLVMRIASVARPDGGAQDRFRSNPLQS